MVVRGEIKRECDNGYEIFVPCVNNKEWVNTRCSKEVLIEFEDTMMVSRQQRKKAYVLEGFIADHLGYFREEAHKILKTMFINSDDVPTLVKFSLSNCSREQARRYIDYLIRFCIFHDIPCGETLYTLAEDGYAFTYACLMKKKCALCGKKADLHHTDGSTVGMGGNRTKVDHLGRKVLPLCRKHHNLYHSMGGQSFMQKFVLTPCEVDLAIADNYNLNKKSKKKGVVHDE